MRFTECLQFVVALKTTILHNSYFFVTEAQKSAYLCGSDFSAILNTTGKPDSKKEVQAMSEMLNRVAAYSTENSACGAADPAPSACGAADPAPSACGSACGAADPDKK